MQRRHGQLLKHTLSKHDHDDETGTLCTQQHATVYAWHVITVHVGNRDGTRTRDVSDVQRNGYLQTACEATTHGNSTVQRGTS